MDSHSDDLCQKACLGTAERGRDHDSAQTDLPPNAVVGGSVPPRNGQPPAPCRRVERSAHDASGCRRWGGPCARVPRRCAREHATISCSNFRRFLRRADSAPRRNGHSTVCRFFRAAVRAALFLLRHSMIFHAFAAHFRGLSTAYRPNGRHVKDRKGDGIDFNAATSRDS